MAPDDQASVSQQMKSEGDAHLLNTYGDDMTVALRKDGSVRLMPAKDSVDPDVLRKMTGMRMNQIYGPYNKTPDPRDVPAIQQFLRENMEQISDFSPAALENAGMQKHEGRFITKGEYDDYLLRELQPPE